MVSRQSDWIDVQGSEHKPRGVTFYRRAVDQATHPRYGVLYLVAIAWSGYFLWANEWALALSTVIAGKLIALASVWTADVRRWSDSAYGKLIRIHEHPANMALHWVGFAGLAYGLWRHEGLWILAGLSVAALGHLWGWPSDSEA